MSIRDSFLSIDTWVRALYIVLFWVLLSLVSWVLGAVVVVQFLIVMSTGERNAQLVKFGVNLGEYLRQIVEFVSFADDEKPFPFSDFPDSSLED